MCETQFQSLGLENTFVELPTLLVLVAPEMDGSRVDRDDVPQLSAVFFNHEKGEMTYVNIMQFFYQVMLIQFILCFMYEYF